MFCDANYLVCSCGKSCSLDDRSLFLHHGRTCCFHNKYARTRSECFFHESLGAYFLEGRCE